MSYSIHPEAEEELGEAALYYAKHVSRRVAEAFLEEFLHVLSVIELNPGPAPLEDVIRVYEFSRFRYSMIYFESVDGHIEILAVSHHSRRPGYWRGRR